MTEPDAFETRLRAAMRRHVEDIPGGFDAVAFARMVVVAEPRRQPGISPRLPALTLGRSTARFAWFALLATLLVALAVGLVAVGNRPTLRGWQRLDLPGGGTISDVVRGPNGFVAVGLTDPGDQTIWGNPAIWRSSDGRSWKHAAVDDTSGGCGVSAVAAGGPGYVAVGGADDGSGSVPGPCLWVSSDGENWTRIPEAAIERSSLAAAGGLYVSDIAAIDGRLVAVGGYALQGSSLGGSIPAIWTSTDGRDWRLVDPLDGASPGFFGGLNAVIEGGPGLVAIGEIDAGPQPAAWVSTDGITWRRAPAAEGDWPSRLWSIARGPSGTLVAFGRGPGEGSLWADGNGGVPLDGPWTSTDGLTWTPAIDLEAFKPSRDDLRVSIASVAGTQRGFVAVATESRHVLAKDTRGTTTAMDLPVRGVVWTSEDGRTWTRLPDDPALADAALTSVIAVDHDLIVSGSVAHVVDPAVSESWTGMPTTWVLTGGASIEG